MLPVTDVVMPVPPTTFNVPPPDTEPVPELADNEIVVETETFEAEVTRPAPSMLTTGIWVAPPYTPAVTLVFGNLAEFSVPVIMLLAFVVSNQDELANPET